MSNFGLVRYHVLSSIRASIAEANGFQQEADKMRAQGNLRLMVMSDEELRELARMLSFLPSRPAESVYQELKNVIEEQKESADEWVVAFGVTPHNVKQSK
ncbi:MAG: hypothetical protein FJZ95_09260 [Chloroflexi bacterium]|nr:hypothetical protein [Chloroflexota bacterium]